MPGNRSDAVRGILALRLLMCKSLPICKLLILLGAVLIGCQVAAPSLKPDDKTPHPPPFDYEDWKKKFGDGLKKVLSSDSAAIEAVNTQIAKVLGEGGAKASVPLEIYLVDEEEFKKEYASDGDPKDKEQLEKKASEIFSGKTAHTYIPPKDPPGLQKVKIKIFKKQALNELLNDDKFINMLVHELVHAKLYAIGILGKKPPFEDDHDSERFKKEIADLLKKLNG